MSISEICRRRWLALIALPIICYGSGEVLAQDVDVRIYESTLNEFVDELQPVQFTGRYAFRTTIDLGPFGRHTITWCDSGYAGTLDGLEFDINSNRIAVEGDAAFSWCGVGFGAPGPELTGTGDVTYNFADSTVRFNFEAVNVQPTLHIFDSVITLPITINIASMFNVPPLRVGSTYVSFATAEDSRYVRLTPIGVTVTKRNGYIQLTTNLAMQ